jgi:ubiquinol-cytochrome c reductase cytochrome b subunit
MAPGIVIVDCGFDLAAPAWGGSGVSGHCLVIDRILTGGSSAPEGALLTPANIVPEWYLLPVYAILRSATFDLGPVSSKTLGVMLVGAAFAAPFSLALYKWSTLRGRTWMIVLGLFPVLAGLGWCGAQNPALPIWTAGPFRAEVRWVEGGEPVSERVRAPSEARAMQIFDERAAALKTDGAQIVMTDRTSPTEATLIAVRGGRMRTFAVEAPDPDRLEARIADRKAMLLAAGFPFAEVERRMPFGFTATHFAQALTFLYFLIFALAVPLSARADYGPARGERRRFEPIR